MKREKDGTIILETVGDTEYWLRRDSNKNYSPQWNSRGKIDIYNTRSAILSAMLSVLYEHHKNGIHEAEYGVLAYRMKERNPALSRIGNEKLLSEVRDLFEEHDKLFKSKHVEYPCAGLVRKITPEGRKYFKEFCA